MLYTHKVAKWCRDCQAQSGLSLGKVAYHETARCRIQ